MGVADAPKTLIEGRTYRNKRGDVRGPMRFVEQSHSPGWFVDQHGTQFHADGTEVNHMPNSTANIDLSASSTESPLCPTCGRAKIGETWMEKLGVVLDTTAAMEQRQ